MEDIKNMQDLMQQIEQKIEQLKLATTEKQADLANQLTEKMQQSQQIQQHLTNGQQQLAAQLDYSSAVLLDLEQGLDLDFSQEMAEFEQACLDANADSAELSHRLEQTIQEKITHQFNELKAKTYIALQELSALNWQIQNWFGGLQENPKPSKVACFTHRMSKKLRQGFLAGRQCLADSLERSALKLRPR